MVLLQIDPPRVAAPPLEGDAPRPVDVKRIPLWLAAQDMEVEAREVHIGQVLRSMQRAPPVSTPLHKIGPNSARVILEEQASQPFVTKTLDHETGYAVGTLV